MRKSGNKRNVRLAAFFYLLAIAGTLVVVNACNKSRCNKEMCVKGGEQEIHAVNSTKELPQGNSQSKVVSVLTITTSPDGKETWVNFRELAEQFSVTDVAVLASLTQAQKENKPVSITFNPWSALVSNVAPVSAREVSNYNSRTLVNGPGASMQANLNSTNEEVFNNSDALGVLNTSSPATGLTDVVPDMATAQIMFDYLENQCCNVPGPYGVDHCITYQYCQDGCYARAHKMCYVINNRYHYATHKIFSFAYPGTYTLSVQAQKWRGCCIRWWYHVAPLVNIKTPSGVKAFVFDPAMFDQPVLLATWLHAQQNPVCAGSRIPKVTSYKIQPTSSYAPNDTSTFITDPLYTDTDATLVSYHSLISCP